MSTYSQTQTLKNTFALGFFIVMQGRGQTYTAGFRKNCIQEKEFNTMKNKLPQELI